MLTFWFQRNDFVEIMEMLDKRLNDKGKNWRHVFKVSERARKTPMLWLICAVGFDIAGLLVARWFGECGVILQGQHLCHQVSRFYASDLNTPDMLGPRTLKEFVYVDEDGKDTGMNVRAKAKDITNLLQDDDRLRRERRAYVPGLRIQEYAN